MVRAILDGRKAQTRRIAKAFNPPEFEADAVHEIAPGEFIGWDGPNPPEPIFTQKIYRPGDGVVCPYGIPGNRLWVREKWALQWNGTYQYAADDPHDGFKPNNYTGRWRPSIHMPRVASRIILEITDVRVERLHDISRDDAKAEGATKAYLNKEGYYTAHEEGTYKEGFAAIWQSINGPKSWEANPWVWVVKFKKI